MLTIGEFSRLSRVTPRMLRHYDALGLLHPEVVGKNGYRYYRQEQLSRLARIQWLKDCGFSLHEIGPLLALEDRPRFAGWRRTSSVWKEFLLWKTHTMSFCWRTRSRRSFPSGKPSA